MNPYDRLADHAEAEYRAGRTRRLRGYWPLYLILWIVGLTAGLVIILLVGAR